MYSRLFVFYKNEIQLEINNLQSTEVQYMPISHWTAAQIAALPVSLKLPTILLGQ